MTLKGQGRDPKHFKLNIATTVSTKCSKRTDTLCQKT